MAKRSAGGVAVKLDPVTLTTNDAGLAVVFGVSRSAVKKWATLGLPKLDRGGYPLPECVQWKMQRNADAYAQDGKDLNELREELTAAQIEKLNLENAVTRGDLVPVEDVQDALNRLAVTFANQLDALGGRLAHDLAGMADPGLIHKTLTDEARAIREATARIVDTWADEESEGA